MKGVLQCNCGKPIRQKKVIVVHPINKTKFSYTCSETCARKIIRNYSSENEDIDYGTIKIFVNNVSKIDVLQSMNLKNELNAHKRKKRKKKLSNEDVDNFKIDFGLDPDKILKRLINSGEKLYNDESNKK